MSQPYKINLLNGTIFLFSGLGLFIFWYLDLGEFLQTALIPAVLGILLLVMTPGMRSENAVIVKAVSFLTLLIGVIIFIMLLKEVGLDHPSRRKIVLFGVLALSSLISFVVYLKGFLSAKR